MKKIITLLLTLTLLLSAALPAAAASDEEYAAAQRLYSLGLFRGRGFDENGNPDFALDSPATREEAVVMLLRLTNRWQAETLSGDDCPFTDVSDWARGALYYAAESGLVQGRRPGFFDAKSNVTAAEYLTMVLRALSYHSDSSDTGTYEKDFDWDKPWLLSDKIGLTNGEYNESTTSFTRGDMALISAWALDCDMNGNEGFTMFKHICQEGLRGVENEKELDSVLYSDGEKLYSSPRLRMLSAGFWGKEQVYAFMDDLYLLLAAATDVLEAQDDGSVAVEYTQHTGRFYSDDAWLRDYGSFGLEQYKDRLSMSYDGRFLIYSLPYDGTHSRRDPEEPAPELPEWTGLYMRFIEQPSSMGGFPGTMNFVGGVSFLYYGELHYINDDNPSLCGSHSYGYPVFVSADEFLAYFGFDCTLELSDSADGLVWSLAWNGTETEETA